MKKIITALLLSCLLAACASPKYTAAPIAEPNTIKKVAIINNKATRSGFRKAMESWLTKNNYSYTILPDGSKYDSDTMTLEYIGNWHWDLALYLQRAEITAFQDGQRAGRVLFEVPYTANPSKFGSAAERINNMMDMLFGKITESEATEKVGAMPKNTQ